MLRSCAINSWKRRRVDPKRFLFCINPTKNLCRIVLPIIHDPKNLPRSSVNTTQFQNTGTRTFTLRHPNIYLTMPSESTLLPNTVASAVAGIWSRVCTHPLDTAKARLQAIPGGAPIFYRSPWDVLRRTAQTEGIRGLYRGFGAVIVGGTPGTVLYLCSYEVCKEQLSNGKQDAQSNFVVHFVSGMIAETIACIVYVPVDVVKERMQIQHPSILSSTDPGTTGNYRNSWDALKQIAKNEGLAGVYRGYGATLASFGPFSALYFVFYERLKLWTRQHLQTTGALGGELPFQWTVLCSASAGALASWITSPLDMAKLRLQVQRGQRLATVSAPNIHVSPSHPPYYTGMIDCLLRTMRESGWKGLFRGAGARVLHIAPATTISMTAFETCRSFVSQFFL